ncbi:MAG TPA: hypothetical protein V6C65_35600 [Allocoleopsis sp.]
MANRVPVYVKVSTRATWLYGFSTSLDANDRTALGHVDYGANATGVVFGVNSPKPARMKKTKESGETVSSFVHQANRSTALTAGWKLIKRARARVSRATARSVPVYVEVAVGSITVKYAWNMKKTLYDAISSDRPTLGIKDVATERDPFDLVWGANLEPPRAINATSKRSTFYSTTVTTLPNGWTGSGGEQE